MWAALNTESGIDEVHGNPWEIAAYEGTWRAGQAHAAELVDDANAHGGSPLPEGYEGLGVGSLQPAERQSLAPIARAQEVAPIAGAGAIRLAS